MSEIQLLRSHHTRNVTGFGLDHLIFGKIFMGHFDPIHKVPEAYTQMIPIFEEYDIIAGDMNAGWHRLIQPTKYSKKPLVNSKKPGYVYGPISYLTPVQPSDPRDARLDMVICKYEQPIPINVGVTFDEFHKYETPRLLMKALEFPSDHRPIKAHIKMEEGQLILAFWNVSDPVYWSKCYPTAMDGYDLVANDGKIDAKKEHDRLESILKWVDYLLENCNILGLAEVPIRLIPDLQIIAKKYDKIMVYRSEHSNTWRPNDPISQMVVMY